MATDIGALIYYCLNFNLYGIFSLKIILISQPYYNTFGKSQSEEQISTVNITFPKHYRTKIKDLPRSNEQLFQKIPKYLTQRNPKKQSIFPKQNYLQAIINL